MRSVNSLWALASVTRAHCRVLFCASMWYMLLLDVQSDSDEDSDDAAFEAYKASRIAAVQASLPTFGTYARVNKLEFAKLVKEVHELCYVVCHVYENVSWCTHGGTILLHHELHTFEV